MSRISALFLSRDRNEKMKQFSGTQSDMGEFAR